MVDKDAERTLPPNEPHGRAGRRQERGENSARLGGQHPKAQPPGAARDAELSALRRELQVTRTLLGEKDAALAALRASLSWRITAPLRAARTFVARLARTPRPKRDADAPIDPAEMVAAAPKLCIFAHYDPKAVVADYVFELLNGIASAGYATVFVSSAERITEPCLDRLRGLCVRVFTRGNAGRDFASWQFGLRRLKRLEDLEWLLLANDSVFGPLFDLGGIMEKMERSGADFWGITDSHQVQWHLQSYFVCFRGDVVRSGVFQRFFGKDFAALTKRQIVDQGELELSQALLAAGWQGSAFCPYETLDAGRYDFSLNPMHHYWDKLVAEAHCPFLKIELLRDNPFKIGNLGRFREIVSAASDYELTAIEAYLDSKTRQP